MFSLYFKSSQILVKVFLHNERQVEVIRETHLIVQILIYKTIIGVTYELAGGESEEKHLHLLYRGEYREKYRLAKWNRTSHWKSVVSQAREDRFIYGFAKGKLPQSPVASSTCGPPTRPAFLAIFSRNGEVVKDNTASNCHCNKARAFNTRLHSSWISRGSDRMRLKKEKKKRKEEFKKRAISRNKHWRTRRS